MKSMSVFLSTAVRVLFSSNLHQNIGLRRNTSDTHGIRQRRTRPMG